MVVYRNAVIVEGMKRTSYGSSKHCCSYCWLWLANNDCLFGFCKQYYSVSFVKTYCSIIRLLFKLLANFLREQIAIAAALSTDPRPGSAKQAPILTLRTRFGGSFYCYEYIGVLYVLTQ